MPAKKCPGCLLYYPQYHGAKCEVCEGSLELDHQALLPPKWREEVDHRKLSLAQGGGERQEVINWRLTELLRAGFGLDDAQAMAESLDVDLHRAVALVVAGCPPGTAARILL